MLLRMIGGTSGYCSKYLTKFLETVYNKREELLFAKCNTLCTISVLWGINKSLQRLPRYAELWEGQGVCHILQSWEHFFLGP